MTRESKIWPQLKFHLIFAQLGFSQSVLLNRDSRWYKEEAHKHHLLPSAFTYQQDQNLQSYEVSNHSFLYKMANSIYMCVVIH